MDRKNHLMGEGRVEASILVNTWFEFLDTSCHLGEKKIATKIVIPRTGKIVICKAF